MAPIPADHNPGQAVMTPEVIQHLAIQGQHLANVSAHTQAITTQVMTSAQQQAERARQHDSVFAEFAARTAGMWDHIHEQVSSLDQGHSAAAQAHMDQVLAAIQSMSGSVTEALGSGLGQMSQTNAENTSLLTSALTAGFNHIQQGQAQSASILGQLHQGQQQLSGLTQTQVAQTGVAANHMNRGQAAVLEQLGHVAQTTAALAQGQLTLGRPLRQLTLGPCPGPNDPGQTCC